MKIATIIGTRPEIIRLSRIIAKFDQYFDHIIVHTGQNYDYELNQVFFDDLSIRKPNHFLDAAGKSPCETVGIVIARVDEVFEKERPDACLILGDTNSSLAAYSAKRRKIPIFHMEAGNRCFDMRVPEEINRRVVDHLADINLTYTVIARDYLIREGIAAERIVRTGSPMLEVLSFYHEKIVESDIRKRLSLEKGGYLIASLHREENLEDTERFSRALKVLKAVSNQVKKPVILSTHPRTHKQITALGIKLPENIVSIKPLGFFDYVHLQMHAAIVLSDSGTITEEASILGFPAINLRETHERPEGMEEGAVILGGLDVENVLNAVNVLNNGGRSGAVKMRIVEDYDVPNVSEKVVRLVISYTHYVNRFVWRKER